MKNALPLFLVLCLALDASAQNTKGSSSLTGKINFGVKVGLNASNTDFNRGFPVPAVPVQTSWKAGFVAGFLLQVPLSQTFSLQQEYLYSQMGGKINSSGTEYAFSYLSLPLLAKYALFPRFALLAGPQFDLLIQANQRVNGISSDVTHDTEERSLGATAGLEFYVLNNLSLTARYVYGLNNIGTGQRSAVTEFKYESVQFTTDIKF